MSVLGGGSLRDWIGQILSPHISDAQLNAKLRIARQHLPIPVFWLLGKAQSGKTSLIQALTGSSLAEIGNGFQTCSRTARFFDFPDGPSALVRFLDTRGLAETAYDPAEDIGWCEQQAHLLIAVVKAMDHQQESVAQAVQEVRKKHPDWPLIVAQTALHEGYPGRESEHALPYPFDSLPFAEGPSPDLCRSLLKQREWFDGMNARFVPLDFTLAEDGYEPRDYGIEALWDAIEETLPLGLRAMLGHSGKHRLLNDEYARKAHPHIVSYSIGVGLAAAIPVPLASMATEAAIQAKLLHSIASIYGLSLTPKSVAEVGGALGVGVLAGMGGRELAKLIPGYGQTVALGVAGLYGAAVTYGLGRVFCFYFAGALRGHAFSSQVLRELYREEFRRGRAMLAESLKRAKA
ncbi:MAG: DUF697 domain-containing protein [Methylococcaceae bacterium]|nr:DUF697 domain-containing protein [Methylococcaceae bacterium]